MIRDSRLLVCAALSVAAHLAHRRPGERQKVDAVEPDAPAVDAGRRHRQRPAERLGVPRVVQQVLVSD